MPSKVFLSSLSALVFLDGIFAPTRYETDYPLTFDTFSMYSLLTLPSPCPTRIAISRPWSRPQGSENLPRATPPPAGTWGRGTKTWRSSASSAKSPSTHQRRTRITPGRSTPSKWRAIGSRASSATCSCPRSCPWCRTKPRFIRREKWEMRLVRLDFWESFLTTSLGSTTIKHNVRWQH